MKRERRFRRRVCTGFTLIELLIIVAIIGVLVAIAIPGYLGAQARAKRSAVKENAANAAKELHVWLSAANTQDPGLAYADTNGDGVMKPIYQRPAVELVNDLAVVHLTYSRVVNPYDGSKKMFVIGDAYSEPGSVYLKALTERTIRVVGVVADGSSGSMIVYDRLISVD